MFTPKKLRSTPAFTLVELLTVIAIIAVLMGILFPTIGSAIENAKKVKAKNDAIQLVTAIKGYYTEYGKYPIPANAGSGDQTFTGTAQANLLNVLRAPKAPTTWVDDNPRKIVFLNVPDAKNLDKQEAKQKEGISTSGKWLDPWGNEYRVKIDGDYDNTLTNPYGSNAGATDLSLGVIVWSIGRDAATTSSNTSSGGDKNAGTSKDDVVSW